MENGKLNFDELMEFYLLNNQDYNIEEEEKKKEKYPNFKENQNNESNESNESNERNQSINDISNNNDYTGTNFDSVSIIVSEKNHLIEEMKNYIHRLNIKNEEEISNKNKEIEDLKSKLIDLEENLRIMRTKNVYEVIEFYEIQINKVKCEYSNYLSSMKQTIESNLANQIISSNCSGVKNQIMYFKNLINSLTKQNEFLNEELAELKRIDRMNYIYKNLLNKFAHKIETNKKSYLELAKNQSSYVKNLEEEIKNLKVKLHEEKMNFIRISSSRSEVEKLVDTINNNKHEIHVMEKKQDTTRNHVISTNSYSNLGYLIESPKSSLISSKLHIYKSEDLAKIITSSKIILDEKLEQLIEIYDYLMAKCFEIKTYSKLEQFRISIKKQSNLSKDIIEDIVNEISFIKNTWQESYVLFNLMQEMLKGIFETWKKSKDAEHFDQFLKKMIKIFVNKIEIK